MLNFNGKEWKAPKYKITRTVDIYDDQPELYPDGIAEEIILTAEQQERLEEIRYTEMGLADAENYVLNGIGSPPDTRPDIDKLIDLIPPENMTDEVVATVPEWKPDQSYSKGIYLSFDIELYKVLQSHKSQPDWSPAVAVSLFERVLTDPTGATTKEWTQPDSTNPYMKGDRVLWTDGKVYESTIDNNVWSITAYPQGWLEVHNDNR